MEIGIKWRGSLVMDGGFFLVVGERTIKFLVGAGLPKQLYIC